MPWEPSDADRHIKGLSKKQKATWAKIANRVLEACLESGKDRAFCEGYAIRVANSIAPKTAKEDEALRPQIRLNSRPRQLHEIRGEIRAETIRHDEVAGVLTAEVILSKEAVLPYEKPGGGIVYEYIPADELRRQEFLDSCWGKPVTDGHPKDEMVTMETLSDYAKGALHGPFQALDTEDGVVVVGRETIWDPKLIQEILEGRKRQVSIGRWTVVKSVPGEWRGKRYDAVQTDLIVNHLAHTDHGRQGEECRIVLDEEALSAPKTDHYSTDYYLRELDGLFDKPIPEILPAIRAVVDRAKEETPLALGPIGNWIVDLRRRIDRAVQVAGRGRAPDLEDLLAKLKAEFPEIVEREPVRLSAYGDSGGERMNTEKVKLDVAGVAVEVPGEAWSPLGKDAQEAILQGFQTALDAVRAQAQAELQAARDKLTKAESLAQALRDEFNAFKTKVEQEMRALTATAVADEVEERTWILDAIRVFDPKYAHRGIPLEKMKRDLLARAYPDMKERALARADDGTYLLSDEYVQARVDLLLEQLENKVGASIGPASVRPVVDSGSPKLAELRAKRLQLYGKK